MTDQLTGLLNRRALFDRFGRAPLEGAAVTFTLSIPGIQVVTSDSTTGGDGRAVFRTTIPPGATEGSGLGTILVTTTDFGTTSDRTVINIVP